MSPNIDINQENQYFIKKYPLSYCPLCVIFIYLHRQNKKSNIMYKATFLILQKDHTEIVRSFCDSNLTNVLVYVGDVSWSLKHSDLSFCVDVQLISTDTSTTVFTFSNTDI